MTFDFRPIAEKYPTALSVIPEYVRSQQKLPAGIYTTGYSIESNGRLLVVIKIENTVIYDRHFNPLELDFFFDEQSEYGIHGWVRFGGKNWMATVWETHRSKAFTFSVCASRSEALIALWLKEFEILEERLNAGK